MAAALGGLSIPLSGLALINAGWSRLPSTALGFEKGIAPAPGLTIDYRGQEYLVVEVAAVDNSPTFSGGSRFVITVRGGALEVGLKAMDGDVRQVAATSLR